MVAENGAVLCNPASKESRALSKAPPPEFVERLRGRGVPDIHSGAVIVALWRPHEKEAIDVIRDMGLELQVIFNNEAVMILPSGINKMTGLAAALKEIGISKHNVVGVGDAENDHAFLDYCECAVAVENAIPALKEHADFVTANPRGEGVVELAEKLLANDLADASRPGRHEVVLGTGKDGTAMNLSPYGRVILVCGQSGSGKSTLVLGLTERAADQGYQVCLIDPEGDYGDAGGLTATGDASHPPSLDHLEKLLDNPETQVAVNLVGVGMDDRPEMFNRVLSALVQERRTRTGRPHWLVVDEAHHMLPPERLFSGGELALGDAGSLVLITVRPGHVSRDLLKAVNTLIVTGKDSAETIHDFCEKSGRAAPQALSGGPEAGEVLLWDTDSDRPVAAVKTELPRGEHRRHIRKYAEGELEEERVFYFRGAEGKLNLRAANLTTFLTMAQGIDDETWLFHLHHAEYSGWLRSGIKDAETADAVQAIEEDGSLTPAESRDRIRQAIESKYTAPA